MHPTSCMYVRVRASVCVKPALSMLCLPECACGRGATLAQRIPTQGGVNHQASSQVARRMPRDVPRGTPRRAGPSGSHRRLPLRPPARSENDIPNLLRFNGSVMPAVMRCGAKLSQCSEDRHDVSGRAANERLRRISRWYKSVHDAYVCAERASPPLRIFPQSTEVQPSRDHQCTPRSSRRRRRYSSQPRPRRRARHRSR